MRKLRSIVIILIAFTFMLPSLAAGQAKPQPLATVPKVEGMPLAAAQQTMVSARLNAVVKFENVTDQAKNGVVLKQEIPAGKTLSPGSSVPVVVGKYTQPPAQLAVPKVTGMLAANAQQMLTQQGWKVNSALRYVPDRSQAGIVLQQAPAPGTKAVPQQTTVTLTVGSVSQPPRNISRDYQPGQLNPPIKPDSVNR